MSRRQMQLLDIGLWLIVLALCVALAFFRWSTFPC